MTISNHQKTTLQTSGDGSHTLYSGQFNQFFHNPNGAIAESRHLFFEMPGLLQRLAGRDHFTIFEAGFGTGLNLLILLETLDGMEIPPHVTFVSVEGWPISGEEAKRLNHADRLLLPKETMPMPELFDRLEPGLNRLDVSGHLSLELFIGRFADMPSTGHRFDALFFDPFSPDKNPEFWGAGVFRRLADESHPGAILSTYCAASVARAAMAVGGWLPYRLPGALGKREMTVAVLPGNPFSAGLPVNAGRLAERYLRGELHLP